MKIKLEMIKREIAGETYLVPIGQAVKSYNGLFCLTEVAAFLWDRLPGAESEDELVRAVLEEYEASPDEVRADVAEFVGKLRSMGIVE